MYIVYKADGEDISPHCPHDSENTRKHVCMECRVTRKLRDGRSSFSILQFINHMRARHKPKTYGLFGAPQTKNLCLFGLCVHGNIFVLSSSGWESFELKIQFYLSCIIINLIVYVTIIK